MATAGNPVSAMPKITVNTIPHTVRPLAPVQVHRPALPGAAAHMLPPHRRRLPLGAGHSLRAGDRASLPLDIIRVAGGSAPGTSGQLSEQQNKADGPDRADQQYDGNDPGEQVPRIRSNFHFDSLPWHRPPVTAACSVCYSITEVIKVSLDKFFKKDERLGCCPAEASLSYCEPGHVKRFPPEVLCNRSVIAFPGTKSYNSSRILHPL